MNKKLNPKQVFMQQLREAKRLVNLAIDQQSRYNAHDAKANCKRAITQLTDIVVAYDVAGIDSD